MLKPSIVLACLAAVLISGPVTAETTRNMAACLTNGPYVPQRQTVVLIDGSLTTETGNSNALPFWRTELARFTNAQARDAAVLMAPHEHITLGILRPDGTGVNTFFEGCLPLLAPGEIEELRSKETKLDWFLGKGWEDANIEIAEEFEKSAAIAAVNTARALASVAPEEGSRFADSTLVASLRNFAGVDLNLGIPRVVVITDLSKAGMPDGTKAAVVTMGHADGASAGLQLGYSELHLISKGSAQSRAAFDYSSAFFLAGGADLKSLTSEGGAITNIPTPIGVRVFAGSILVKADPELRLPIRMRIAWDQNYTVVNSWMEETQIKKRYTPFGGNLSCASGESCSLVGDGLFAQKWTNEPGGDAECVAGDDRLPFGGFRNLELKIEGDTINGVISDEACFFSGMKDGLPFEMMKVENGRM